MTFRRFRPRSRAAWRQWLDENHDSSPGTWLVYAKKHTKLPTLSYEDAVEEALCFGWIDSLIKSIDDRFHMQIFTPRKPKSAWSALNKARVARLTKAGAMKQAGLAAVAAAKKSGRWDSRNEAALTVPAELQRALDADPAAKRNWSNYSDSGRKAFLFRLGDAKRPETRATRIQEIVLVVANNVSMTVLRQAAMSGASRALLDSLRPTATRAADRDTPAAMPPRRPRPARSSRRPSRRPK